MAQSLAAAQSLSTRPGRGRNAAVAAGLAVGGIVSAVVAAAVAVVATAIKFDLQQAQKQRRPEGHFVLMKYPSGLRCFCGRLFAAGRRRRAGLACCVANPSGQPQTTNTNSDDCSLFSRLTPHCP